MPKPYAVSGRLFVLHDGRWEDEIVTESGIKLYKDTTFNPEWGVRIYGTVATIPLDGNCEVSEGDKVYFHYFTLQYDENRVTIDGVDYWLAELEKVFVKIVDGNIVPVHGWCLIDIGVKEIDHSTIIIPDSVKKKQVDADRALMVSRVRNARNRVRKLEDELLVISNEVRGTGLWVPAYDRVMDAKNTRVWLEGYLDSLTQE